MDIDRVLDSINSANLIAFIQCICIGDPKNPNQTAEVWLVSFITNGKLVGRVINDDKAIVFMNEAIGLDVNLSDNKKSRWRPFRKSR